MRYTQMLNQRLKNAGREYARSRGAEKAEDLSKAIRTARREAEDTDSFFPWAEAAARLNWSGEEEQLIAVLWGLESRKETLSEKEFLQLQEELAVGMENGLPIWYVQREEGIRLSPVLTGWLEGEIPELPEGLSLRLPEEETAYGLDALLQESDAIFRLADLQEPFCLCLAGESGSGREFAMERIALRQGLTLLLAEGDCFRATAEEQNACVLCARLYNAFFCIRLGKEERGRLLTWTEEKFSFYGLIRESSRTLREDGRAGVITRFLEKPDRSGKLQMAREVLGGCLGRLPEGMTEETLTGRQLPTGAYLKYLYSLRAELLLGTTDARKLLPPVEGGRLQLLPANRSFSELKLPAAQYGKLREICRMISARGRVLEQWGFGQKFSYGNGISVLFYGAPGTGKTMAAQVLAAELGLPLYRVDLSQLISKYIGETQKNIGQIFDEAERSECILLFDEADAIFTRRSDVSDAQDRYSNAETAYLLQRIEQYGGVCILATNLLQNFDDAFRRRISYMVHFPLPDEGLRQELWESIFPEETPLGEDLDPALLARAFELSGASIKNAALHGALLAAAEGTEVQMRHLMDSIRNEYEKQGKNFSASQRELLDAFR
ncbi:ATP-binding protein [Faecalicatena orotica]|nr:ATP-binding protein [Faecalicatena orotica]